jgi:hypothetical protein
MQATAVDALVHPGEFFAERDVGLRSALVIVSGDALLAALTGIAFVVAFRQLLPRRVVLLAVGFTFVVVVVVSLLAWLVFAGILYLLTWPFADEGSFRGLLGPVGWGMLPQVLKGCFLLVATVFALSGLSPPADQEAAREFARQVDQGSLVALAAIAGTARVSVTSSLSQLQLVAGVTGTLWSGYVWVPALEEARGVSRRQATGAVAVVVVLMLLNSGL